MIVNGIIPQPGDWVRVRVRACGIHVSTFGQFQRFLDYDHDELRIADRPDRGGGRKEVEAGGIELSSGDLTEIGDDEVEMSPCNQMGTYV